MNTLTPQHPNTLEQRRFTVAEYHAMGEAGVFAPDEDAVYVCRRPRGDEYAELRVAERAGVLTPVTFPDVPFPADEVLG